MNLPSTISTSAVHPANVYPIFVGASGNVTFAPYPAVTDDTGVHPSTSNVTVYVSAVHCATYVTSHAGIVVASVSTTSHDFHHWNTFHALSGPAITGIFAPYTTFFSFTVLSPSLYVTL